jgi:hypothetical protein
VFNRSYQAKAVRKAGGGRKLAADAALHLPWAGIFEPWRSLVLTALAADSLAIAKPRNAAKGCKKRSGRLQGVQLALFPEPAQNAGKSPADSTFPPLAEMFVPIADDDKPLADLFPEAYL